MAAPPEIDVSAGGTLHWVPRGSEALRARMGLIGEELARGDIRVMVVDVSVEVAVFARLYGIPVVVMAQPGDRSDRPHEMAYDLAARLLAPWPAFAKPRWPQHWLNKTVHVGAFSRFDGRPVVSAERDRRVLALWGSGGLDIRNEDIRAAALATTDWHWSIVGQNAPDESLPNLTWHGWVDDVWLRLSAAEVVVTHAGQNALAEVAAARRPAVVLPQDRPHDEQQATADALRDAEIGVIASTWPRPTEWPRLLERARARGGGAWSQWSPGDGAQRAAAVLDAFAV
ncbi:glycosyltransferase [Actinomadura madurae]|uniref:glycosyltransferase n=1 Tax=Actinomadura madurae TaxID=1993 RepID=UPI001C67D67B|nr:glycosyltransferase [Actinomadura madurae]